jgi:hypothetical protein
MKASPVTIQFRHWLEGDLLLLTKASVWAEVGSTLVQQLMKGDRRSLYSSVLPPVVTLVGAITLWRWNAAFLLALLVGGGGSILFYRATQKRFSGRRLEQWLKSPQAPIGLSLGAGFGMLVLSYSALTVWQDLNSPGLAMLLFTQELGIFSVLGLAVWLILNRSNQSNQSLHSFERCVAGLLHRDALRRLMAVRQLATLAQKGQLSAVERSQAWDYLYLLAQTEKSPLIGQAIQDSLVLLRPSQRNQLSNSVSADLLVNSTISARRIKSPVAINVREEVMADRLCQPSISGLLALIFLSCRFGRSWCCCPTGTGRVA